LEEYRHLLDALAKASPDFRYEIVGPTLDVAPLDIPVDSPIVQSVSKAHETVLGSEGTISGFAGGTDAPNLGFPTLVFGPGPNSQAHTTNEFVEIEEMIAATKVYLLAALDLLTE